MATIAVATSGFRATGIYPLNPSLFTDDDFAAADAFSEHHNEFIPVIKNDYGSVALTTDETQQKTFIMLKNSKQNMNQQSKIMILLILILMN